MNILLLDAFCVLLIVVGFLIAFGKPSQRPKGGPASGSANDDPRVYARRIGGVMLMAFGLALAVMFTTFHYA